MKFADLTWQEVRDCLVVKKRQLAVLATISYNGI